jgi:hypothetical protein
LMVSSCRAVSGVVPDWRPRPDLMAYFLRRAVMMSRMA